MNGAPQKLARAVAATVFLTAAARGAGPAGASDAVPDAPPFAEYFRAMRSGELDKIDRYLADDYLLIGVGGNTRDKAGRMGWLRRNVSTLSTIQPADVVVRRIGDVAVVTGLVVIEDEASAVRERFTHVWAHREGRWQMISGQVTAVAPELRLGEAAPDSGQDPAEKAAPGPEGPVAGRIEQELRAMAERWRTSYNAKDATAVASLYAPDAYYVSAHVVARGRSEIRAYFQRGIEAGGHVDAVELVSIGHSGDLAYWVGTYEATNAGQKVRGRNVVVARRTGSEWLMLAHETAVADPP